MSTRAGWAISPSMIAEITPLKLALILIAALAANLALTGLLRIWLLRRQILDRPNERSAHAIPVPRGAGIALLAVLLPIWFAIDPRLWPLLLASLLLGAVGWWDDLRGLAPWPRLAAQTIAVAVGLSQVGAITHGLLPPFLDFGLAALGWLWFINLFNFMDGIDGIAGAEAVSIGLGLVLIALWSGGGDLAPLAIALVGASIGFLYWNWHPAKLFLGDVGSQSLGFLLGYLLLRLAAEGAGAAALILPLYFLVDATWTLLRRTFEGENILAAHAQHIYQQSVRLGRRHDQVVATLFVGNLALIAFALGSEMGERPVALLGAGLTVLVLIRRLLAPSPAAPNLAGRD
jgi:UDP-N-acetylmuramyl pentapeptide phosphotransferase/UDP-N-acetylglucosamine-1-phosphate transferase